MAALIIAIFPQNSSRGNWEEQQDRTDPNSQFELARKPAWLLAFRQFGLPKWKHDFECCTFDHSDNSPCLFSSGFLSGNLLKNSLERKQERRQKIFDFEIFCVEEYQGESGGRNSQIPPKFRVSPIMTTSILPHTSVSYHKFFRCATPESIILPPAACNRGEGAVVWTDVCWSGTEDMIM